MPATLDQILAATRRRLIQSKAAVRIEDLHRSAEKHEPRGFRSALQSASQRGPAVIAELKKASPSRGLIRQDFDPEQLACELTEAGASALSVLTDEEFFQGSLENLRRASSAVQLPCLRKDFIVDEFQIVEARANRADAILLIVSALSQNELGTLMKSARKWHLDVLCEVHDGDELSRAVDAGADVIGVNSRDLKTFKVDLQTALKFGELIPKSAVRVAESGIYCGEDIAQLRKAGYQAFLIGESLMKASHPGETLKELLKFCAFTCGCESLGSESTVTWVKICGITNLEDASVAAEAGADGLGFVFYDKSPRKIDVQTARKIVEQLPRKIEKVGVFVDCDAEQIRKTVTAVGLTAVQLHEDRSLENLVDRSSAVKDLYGVSKVIASMPAEILESGGTFISDAVRKRLFAVLVDSPKNGIPGGTGQMFDWDGARAMVRDLGLVVPMIVAGGLNPSNVAEAIRIFQPFGVDVASGTEAKPGKKDPAKVRAFISAARAASKLQ